MRYFKLPDLGEGLQEAEIVEWHVKPDEHVELDQLLVSVETAKAIVEVPSPASATVKKLFGQEGDVIHVGEPLLEFVTDEVEDTGTVVGIMPTADDQDKKSSKEDKPSKTAKTDQKKKAVREQFIIGSPHPTTTLKETAANVLASPAIRAMAKERGVDLGQIKGSGRQGQITAEDVDRAAETDASLGQAMPLKGVRRMMAKNMTMAHSQVVPVTLFDSVDLHKWGKKEDITIRLVQAIAHACKKEPLLNSWFDGEKENIRLLDQIDVGIAVDTADGLFVPVMRDVGSRSAKNLRKGLNALRADVKARSIPPKELLGASISLSNFGTLAGRYATPVVVPPSVAIVGAGCIFQELVEHKGNIESHPMLPISLSFDHRAITGGEAARFLAHLLKHLAKKSAHKSKS